MMWTDYSTLLLFFNIITSFFMTTSASQALHPDELKALEKIVTTLGIKTMNLSDEDPCRLQTLKIINEGDSDGNPKTNNTILCNCSLNNNMTCHITDFSLKNFTLSGKLPPEFSKLRYIQSINLHRNYLSGTIPMEWTSLPYLIDISLSVNRLSGNLPTGLQNFKTLKRLAVEGNQLSGQIPAELGKLTNLETLFLSSNQFTGRLPSTLARLVNLKEFWICDNNFTGIIPEYIGNWSQLQKLHLYASGLTGPIPDAVARLENLTELTICDTTGINSFPNVTSDAIVTLILRNVSLSGPIPPYIWNKPRLKTLDLSFNKLTGEVKGVQKLPLYTYLTGNMLSGNIESDVNLNSKSNIDLSGNSFSWSSSCKDKSNINTYRSSYLKNNLTGLLPCAGPINCRKYQRSLHINCGGENVIIKNRFGKTTYQADNSETDAATNWHLENWGFSNTGHFTDDDGDHDTYTISTSKTSSGDTS